MFDSLTQGQSLATIDKERRIAAAISVGMRIASVPKFRGKGYRFWHFDANCGSGWNQRVNVPGSPLVFWHVAKTCLVGLEASPFFCDIDQASMRELQNRLSTNPNAAAKSWLLPYDNQEALEVFAEMIRRSERSQFAVGSILVDPNTYYYRDQNGRGAPVDALKWFTREFPRIDVILNLNIRDYQLQKSHHREMLPPRELLASLSKEHWLIARAYVGHARFVLAVGRNKFAGDHRALGFHHLESPVAQLILSVAEGKRQHELPELSRISAASGVPGGSRGGDAAQQGTLF